MNPYTIMNLINATVESQSSHHVHIMATGVVSDYKPSSIFIYITDSMIEKNRVRVMPSRAYFTNVYNDSLLKLKRIK